VYLYAPGCIGWGCGTDIDDEEDADDLRFLSVILLLLLLTLLPFSLIFLPICVLLTAAVELFPADLHCNDVKPFFCVVFELFAVLRFEL
jgi:hypothetical protein